MNQGKISNVYFLSIMGLATWNMMSALLMLDCYYRSMTNYPSLKQRVVKPSLRNCTIIWISPQPPTLAWRALSLATSLEGIIHRDKEHCRTILTDYTDLTQILFPILNYNFICDITKWFCSLSAVMLNQYIY